MIFAADAGSSFAGAAAPGAGMVVNHRQAAVDRHCLAAEPPMNRRLPRYCLVFANHNGAGADIPLSARFSRLAFPNQRPGAGRNYPVVHPNPAGCRCCGLSARNYNNGDFLPLLSHFQIYYRKTFVLFSIATGHIT